LTCVHTRHVAPAAPILETRFISFLTLERRWIFLEFARPSSSPPSPASPRRGPIRGPTEGPHRSRVTPSLRHAPFLPRHSRKRSRVFANPSIPRGSIDRTRQNRDYRDDRWDFLLLPGSKKITPDGMWLPVAQRLDRYFIVLATECGDRRSSRRIAAIKSRVR